MADFKNITDFRKAKTSQFPYQDPTYLSFVILFDYNDRANSPLFSGPAEDFLKKLADGSDNTSSYYADKLAAFREFKKALKTINTEMPWYWQSLGGIERIQQFDPMVAYRGGDDAKLTIGTLESLNLPIAGLMHLYRKACFDERKWNWVIPENLRKFRMYVYVTEVRKIKNISNTANSRNNDGILGENNRPFFMFGLGHCEFDITSGVTPFADLQKSPTDSAANEVVISYESSNPIEARVLNGIIEDIKPDNLSPASELENNNVIGVNDNVFGEDTRNPFNKKIDELKERARKDLKILGEQKKNELIQVARDLTVNRIPSIDNIYQNVVRGIDGATDVTGLRGNIGLNIQENVFGKSGDSIGDALNNAAQNSLGNVYD